MQIRCVWLALPARAGPSRVACASWILSAGGRIKSSRHLVSQEGALETPPILLVPKCQPKKRCAHGDKEKYFHAPNLHRTLSLLEREIRCQQKIASARLEAVESHASGTGQDCPVCSISYPEQCPQEAAYGPPGLSSNGQNRLSDSFFRGAGIPGWQPERGSSKCHNGTSVSDSSAYRVGVAGELHVSTALYLLSIPCAGNSHAAFPVGDPGRFFGDELLIE